MAPKSFCCLISHRHKTQMTYHLISPVDMPRGPPGCLFPPEDTVCRLTLCLTSPKTRYTVTLPCFSRGPDTLVITSTFPARATYNPGSSDGALQPQPLKSSVSPAFSCTVPSAGLSLPFPVQTGALPSRAEARARTPSDLPWSGLVHSAPGVPCAPHSARCSHEKKVPVTLGP